uniref:Uncharacterized protein n=1 Tax=Erpetoichthys calabaricus TaxID=27687 RepID=A0A8C4S765_ERPCA
MLGTVYVQYGHQGKDNAGKFNTVSVHKMKDLSNFWSINHLHSNAVKCGRKIKVVSSISYKIRHIQKNIPSLKFSLSFLNTHTIFSPICVECFLQPVCLIVFSNYHIVAAAYKWQDKPTIKALNPLPALISLAANIKHTLDIKTDYLLKVDLVHLEPGFKDPGCQNSAPEELVLIGTLIAGFHPLIFATQISRETADIRHVFSTCNMPQSSKQKATVQHRQSDGWMDGWDTWIDILLIPMGNSQCMLKHIFFRLSPLFY